MDALRHSTLTGWRTLSVERLKCGRFSRLQCDHISAYLHTAKASTARIEFDARREKDANRLQSGDDQVSSPPPPRFIRPCAPVARRDAPLGAAWVHEIKWDGWRLQAHKRVNGATLYSGRGRDITALFPRISEAITSLPRRSLALDGELVAFDDYNRPNSDLLRRKGASVVAFLFDILESNGADLRGRPWRERRRFLERLFPHNSNGFLHLNQTWDDGSVLIRAVGAHGLKGIVSKRRNAPYRSGTSDAWVKVEAKL